MFEDTNLPSHHALLIGIDAYPASGKDYRPLEGCVRDVRDIEQHLIRIPKPGVQIHTLTASLVTNSTSHRLVGDPGSWPTYSNVIRAIDNTIEHAAKGDFVYLHFSGHGTAFRPHRARSPTFGTRTAAYSNPSTGDLALVLLEEEGSVIRYLRGAQLALLLKGMTDKGLKVTLVLDCCFSGSVMRNEARVRSLVYVPEIDDAYSVQPGQTISSEDDLRRPAYRGASLTPNWLVNPNGYTVITACGPTESAKEVKIDGQFHGLLSYLLVEMFKKYEGVGGRLQYIQQILRAGLEKKREKHGYKQTPVVLGNKTLDFFGYDNPRIGPAPIPVVQFLDGTVRIDAGDAHGVCVGDTFTVSAMMFDEPSASETVSVRNYCRAEVMSVRALTSFVQLSVASVAGSPTLAATTLTRQALKRFPVQIQMGGTLPEGWSKVLAEESSLLVYQARDDPGSHYSFKVTLSDHGSYQIWDSAGQELWEIHESSAGPVDDARSVLKTLEHLASFRLVKELSNKESSESMNHFRASISAHIIGPTGLRIDPDTLIDVQDGGIVEIEVKNEHVGRGYNLYVHPYCLVSTWEVENVHDGDYAVIPSKSTNYNDDFKGASGTWRKKLKMEAPEAAKRRGQESFHDIIKLFVTSRPTSFLSLELPELDHIVERKAASKIRGGSDLSAVEDWLTLSFHIHIHP